MDLHLMAAGTESTKRGRGGLIALSLGGFGIGLTEFIVAGLLTQVATDLRVGLPAAGQLMSGYALGVVAGAMTVTPWLLRHPPKHALLALLGLFVLGNIVTAVAPNYAVVMVGRVIASLCHGGFFGIGAVVAGDLVSPDRRASAIATMFAGLTTANVLGVPLGTWVGQAYGWRATFWMIAVVGVFALAGIAHTIPALSAHQEGTLGDQVRGLLRPQVVLSIAVTMFVFGGVFGAFAYVEPLLTRVSGFAPAAVPGLLVLFGAGLFIGNIVGGHLADKSAGSLVAVATLVPFSLAGLGLAAPHAGWAAAALFLVGLVGFATVPGLQLRVLRHARRAPTLASAANIAAFNLGNTLGVAAGGFALTRAGYVAPVWAAVALCLVGLLVLAGARALGRSRRSA